MDKYQLCYICQVAIIDKYKWCRSCIKRAAKGAARYFASERMLEITTGNIDDRFSYLKSQTNRWERRFKRRLKLRND